MKTVIDFKEIDKGIITAVELLRDYGFETFESCQGGAGHCFEDPTIRFFGSEFDLIRAWEICSLHGMEVFEAKRVYRKVDMYRKNKKSNGLSWDKPFNEIIFKKII